MELCITIEHDNGIKGQHGFTVMTEVEMLAEYGSVDALRASYEDSGIHVYDIYEEVYYPLNVTSPG